MSSNARRTVLFPEPESPVRMTSWRPAAWRGRGLRAEPPVFLGVFFAHHRLPPPPPLVKKFRLPRDDGLQHTKIRVFPLLYFFHKLTRRGEAFFPVLAPFLGGGAARQNPPVRRAQA